MWKKRKTLLDFFTGEAAECKSGSVIFPITLRAGRAGSPPWCLYFPPHCVQTLSCHSAWWISTVSHLSFLSRRSLLVSLVCSSALSLSFMARSYPAYGRRLGDGRRLVCTFSSKLKYSCMCACGLCVRTTSRVCVYCFFFFFARWCIKHGRLIQPSE